MTTSNPQVGRPAHPAVPPPDPVVVAARRTARRAQLVAILALVVALVAVVTSLTALVAGGNQESPPPAEAAPATTSSADQSTEPSVTVESPLSTSTTETRRVTPDSDFQLVFEKQVLHVPPRETCGELRYVDVDEPRSGAEQEIAEFGYGTACGVVKPRIDVADELPISLVQSENATAKDCAEAIQRSPVNEPFVPTEETRLCLITSAEEAQGQGKSQKVALVTVTGIDQDGMMTIQISTWSVPR
jgi:hypothetical protein